MKAYGGVDVQINIFLTPALVDDGWSASRPGRLSPKERTPSTHWTGGWVGPRVGLDPGEEKILDPTGTRTPTRRSSIPQLAAIPTEVFRLPLLDG
jgi:hypothetical protein